MMWRTVMALSSAPARGVAGAGVRGGTGLRIAIGSLACLVLLPAAAAAADALPALTDPAPAKGWIITLGGTAELGPKYDGASAAGFSFMPSISWRRVGEVEGFSAPDDSLDYALYETDRFSFGVAGGWKSGRYSSSSKRLFGMHDVPWTIEAGAFAEYWPIQDRLRTRVEVRQGFHGHHGVVADFSADWVERLGRFTLSGGPRLSLGSASYMRRNFGVSLPESAANGFLAPYRPTGGAKSIGIATALEYSWSEQWSTTLFARYDRMIDQAANSPLVRTVGQRDQITIGLGASYSFRLDL